MTNVRTLPVGEESEEITLALDQLAREGARRMIAAALRAEADEYVERFSDERDEDGRRQVVRNGRRAGTPRHGRVGHDRAPCAEGERQAHRGEQRRTGAGLGADPARVRASGADGRG